ncbi:MAG: glycosyl hydrolase [Gammaproteobacteria bacterium]|nr:glycosyl hydrolase [Gammaproteobacteria bacterium]MDH5584735.1 glycosyl hydrolase [Gammaproteobacteria bacterium]
MNRLNLVAVLLALAVAPVFAADEETPEPGFNEATFKGLEFRSVGPAFMSGRIADIAIHPERQSTWYVGVGSGGVWKTDNRGTTWQPIFENEDSYSIGSITIDPNNPNTVWVGSGENVSGRHVGYGSGVFRSRDGGQNWENLGLKDSEHIGMIRIDPRDSNTVFVAAQGPLWSGGGDRGLFKSTDGGQNWRKVLGAGLGNTALDDQYTGVSEVHMDPRNPDVMYAVSWQRFRNVAVLMDGGPGTGIHKSEDGGETWRELSKGLPEENLGKTGLAISPQNPDVIYATIEVANRKGGFFRSADGGETWEKKNEYISGGTGPHYYQEIFASPHQFDRVYQMDVQMQVTNDGGTTFTNLKHESKHSDHHALAFDPNDEDYLIVGVDGGIYETYDLGVSWRYIANLPTTQFYKVAVDYDEPFYNIYGGTQDNNSQGGPSRTMDVSGISNADWWVTLFADGHQSAVDPNNPDIIYAEWQQGNLTRVDRKTGEIVYIRPQPAEGEPLERFNWDSPILISPHDSKTLFYASQRVWKSDDYGDSWTAISGDITRNENRYEQPVMGRTWSYDAAWDFFAMSMYNTITSLSESPLVKGLVYAGTDDGLIQVTEDNGQTWRRIDKLPGVPDRFFVNDIKADLFDADTVYVVVDDHKKGDYSPYLLKSENRGRSWKSIASNLPERHLLWRVVQDHVKPGLMFVGTEFGVFFTVNGGGEWTKLKGGSPNIPFRDLVIQKRENDLVGATFGRSFYVLDDYSALRNVTSEMLQEDATLFPVRKAPWYVPKRKLGCGEPLCTGSQGDSYFVAPNPDFGAIFTYYLPKALQTSQQARRESEKKLEAENKNVKFAGLDKAIDEQREDAPAIVFTVRNAAGEVVRHVEGPAEAGFHRVAWNLRYPALDAWVPAVIGEEQREGAGVLVVPGTFSVSMQKRVDGVLTDLGQSQSFDVVSIRESTLPGGTQEQRVVFESQLDELRRAADGTIKAIDRTSAELDAIKQTLVRSRADTALYEIADSIQERMLAERDRLIRNEISSFFQESSDVTLTERLWHARFNAASTAYGPTPSQRTSYAIGRRLYDDVVQRLGVLVDTEYEGLKEALDMAEVPWTPGRGVQ